VNLVDVASWHDSDEPITAGYVRSWGWSGHADFALEM